MGENNKSVYAFERKSAWSNLSDSEKNLMNSFSEDYKQFLTQCKTERECVRYVEKNVAAMKYKTLSGAKIAPGERIYIKNDSKNIVLAVIGKKDITEGINIVASHIDCPRLDLKPLPLIEETDIALLKTHYYGGIKKYQWVNVPLALHGTVVKGNGERIDITIGEDESDPLFTIPDLMPHLAHKVQGEKKFFEGIEGENLNLLIGSIPVENEEIKERVKETVLRKLNELYGMTEEDFISAEFEAVPAHPARDIGIDRSMIGAYGHDDRLCSYAAYRALVDSDEIPEKTLLVFLVDKEEIGSYGVTAAPSKFLPDLIAQLVELRGDHSKPSDIRKTLANSFAISGDVGGVVNPMFTNVHDMKNSPRMGYGVILEKYTGSRGKYGASDASAELMGKVRKIFNDNGVVWQPGTLGKVDEGGGGTIAFEIAQMGIQVVDCGGGVLGMHAPFEIASKADVYQTYKAYRAFLKDA